MDSVVEVWCAKTDRAADCACLSPDEIHRASQFRFEADRHRWIAARCLLRRALGEHLGIPPAGVRFVYSEYGKPAAAGYNTKFNLSHSGDLAVCVIGGENDVGIDIEKVRPVPNIESVFRSISSGRELKAFRAMPDESRLSTFFSIWTIKEACVKAEGTGLSETLSEIEVLPPHDDRREIRSGVRCWSVRRFAPAEGYAGAIAVSSDGLCPPQISARIRFCRLRM